MVARLAHVAPVHRPRGADPVQLGKPLAERRAERCHLSRSARGARTGEDRAPAGGDGGVLDERAIGKLGIGREPREREPQPLQRAAVGLVLLQRERQIRRTEAGRGDPGREGGRGGTDDGARESHASLVPPGPVSRRRRGTPDS